MSDDDIEFLDEDAEIVQQCVQLQPVIKIEPAEEEDEEEPLAHVIQKPKIESSLLIERPPLVTERPSSVKKRKKDEEDADYDPIVDSPYFNRKRRYHPSKASNLRKHEADSRSSGQSQSPPVRKTALPRHVDRRNVTIRIPDFDDPLCLPVRALVKDESDARRLKHWNQLCLEQFRNNDVPLRPRNGPVSSSTRTVVIRNLFNKYSGKTETTFWNKITVQGEAGDTRSDVVQAVLPRYREKKILTAYRLAEGRRVRRARDRQEVLLSKERDGEEEILVAYKPDTCLSMVFKMFESGCEADGAVGATDAAEEGRRYLLERGSCTACVRCYQASWRGRYAGYKREGALAECPVCARACSSAHALLAHVKTHAPADVRLHRRAISDVLAKVLPYQYRCRVCQRQCGAVGELRRHLAEHAGAGELYCEVGGHAVR